MLTLRVIFLLSQLGNALAVLIVLTSAGAA